MLTVQDIARRKKVETSQLKPEAMGPYDHQAQRRWIGEDASLIQWTMKSSTSFDGEAKDPDSEID